jgi:hypothetical protein
MRFSVDASEAMRIDSSGNVGIGATTVDSALHIEKSTPRLTLQIAGNSGYNTIESGGGNELIFGRSGAEQMRIDSAGQLLLGRGANVASGAEATRIQFYNTLSTYDIASIRSLVGVGQVNRGELSFAVNNGAGQQERMRLDYLGRVGIGTSSPSAKLDVFYGNIGGGKGVELSGTSSYVADGSYGTSLDISHTYQSNDGSFRAINIDITDTGTSNQTLYGLHVNAEANYFSGKVGIGYASPVEKLSVFAGAEGVVARFVGLGAGRGLSIKSETSGQYSNLNTIDSGSTGSTGILAFSTDGNERVRITSSGNVGIGTSSPSVKLHITSGSDGAIFYAARTGGTNNPTFVTSVTDAGSLVTLRAGSTNNTGQLAFSVSGVGEAMRIDSSGNLLVGTTTSNALGASSGGTLTGLELQSGGVLLIGTNNDKCAIFNRQSSDGEILRFRKDGTTVGSIGTNSNSRFFVGGASGLILFSTAYLPATSSGVESDNTLDLGGATVRFDDVYATNGTIQTSDRNEKQDIESLSEAEQRVAVAAKGLLRKFRWKSSVEEKGDDARIHFGIIAQDLQAAFEAEGLDAGRYAMFIHSTWTDEETGEERSRMGVRYSELLAFIIAAL